MEYLNKDDNVMDDNSIMDKKTSKATSRQIMTTKDLRNFVNSPNQGSFDQLKHS